MKPLALALLAVLLLGCSGSDDEGGGSTATPADKLDRPAPVDTSGGPTNAATGNAGTLSGGQAPGRQAPGR